MSIDSKVESLIRPEIRALKAYHVPDATGLVKLDAMENPYSWPEDVRREWLATLQGVALNRYPDPGARRLRERLRDALAVPGGMELMLGNGSDELIQIVLMALSKPGATAGSLKQGREEIGSSAHVRRSGTGSPAPASERASPRESGATVLAPTPTFVMYEMIATFTGMKFAGVPLTADFSLDMPAMLEAVAKHQPAVIFLAYPNNPTGNLFAPGDVARLIEAAPGLVVLDEAYHAFAGQSFMDRLGKFDNLLVMRTLSKQGLAGLRLGILAGPAPWLQEFDKVRLPYNIGCLTQASAEFALDHLALLDEQARQIRQDREQLLQALGRMRGVQVWPSQTNFILFRVTGRDADEVFEGLRARGVLIKNLNSSGGMLKGCLRVTVGTPDENAAFLKALEAAL